MLHIQLYRARRRHEALAQAVSDETRRPRPDEHRLGYLKKRKLEARDHIASLEILLARSEPSLA